MLSISPRSAKQYLKLRSRPFSSEVKLFEAKSIIPAGYKQVRILNNTTRDAQQSNLSAEMADDHRQEIGKMINDVYKEMKGLPGYEQIWGGTVPMFDIWKRGVQPFDELRRMKKNMPDTPASALIRSNALNAMSNQPRDVVEGFIKFARLAGVDVFTNFCAHNDWRNHVAVAEAVHRAGGHYQAAISWAVHKDPTIYNVQWAVDLFKDLVKLGAHSLYVKDPSGVLTPEIAGVLAAQIKETFPDLPLVFHTHYQTGYAYMTYLKAVENGANGVECSLGLADGAGQPYGLTLLRVFEELGFDTGEPNKEAMQKISDASAKIRQLYATGRIVRTPDIRVESTGIAGGQRTILDKELRDVGQAHLIPKVDIMVSEVRDEGGKVCQVTPVADAYAREAMRRLRGGDPAKNFTPGYAAILTGEGGLVKEPVVRAQQQQALLERAIACVNSLQQTGAFDVDLSKALVEEVLPKLRQHMDELVQLTVVNARVAELKDRIRQLETISKKSDLLDMYNRKISRAGQRDSNGKPIQTVQDRIALLKAELSEQQKIQPKPVPTDEYEALLKQQGSSGQYKEILDKIPFLKSLVDEKRLSFDALKQIVSQSGLLTCCAADLLPPALDKARAAVKDLDKEFLIGLTLDSEQLFEESAVLQASYAKTAVPGMITNFFKNYRENPEFWAPLYDKPAVKESPVKEDRGIMKRGIHAKIATILGSEIMNSIESLAKEEFSLAQRLQGIDTKWLPKGTVGVPTRNAVHAKLSGVQQQLTVKKEEALTKLKTFVQQNPGSLAAKYPSLSGDKPSFRSPPLDSQLKQAENALNELIKLQITS